MTNKTTTPWILIPAYQPTNVLTGIVNKLITLGFNRILVVNDGSSDECVKCYSEIENLEQVVILHHAVNLGKGAALKTGFNYFLLNAPKDVTGIITADADGQHLPEDIYKVSNSVALNPNILIIGAREFDASHPTPLRSKIGNVLTRNVFGLLSGKRLSDTQTGLRYLPTAYIAETMKISSNGYEFELEMLLKAISQKLEISEVPIKTVYFGNNEHSHFNPLLDSIKIYFVFARFLSASIATAFIDYGVFILGYLISSNVLGSLILGRIFAGTFNFLVARNWVFHSHNKASRELPSYFLTVACITLLSFLGINLLTQSLGWGVLTSKLLTEGLMFSVSFLAMRLIVFKSDEEIEPKKTDWDSYYRNPAPTARFTRKFTESLILKLFSKHYSNSLLPPSIAELGGARSCFFQAIRKVYPQSLYTIVDNNQFGLDAFKVLYPNEKNVHSLNANIENSIKIPALSDISFSVGLIEHFNPEGTSKAIAHHFDITKPDGIVMITFPTPTWLYVFVRSLAEWIGVWAFPDERPLKFDEVRGTLMQHGEILHESINWPIILTQGVIVTRKYK